ncbi:MAG: hypothetical protein BWX46_00634 [Candidatus Cloacimonetes bacterium ADurb.Bin003]|nr:MAG: hypothetical protein BWX46_00634 [Candidatus Cloacimonetes bacterium ADurb.Bin003]
MFIGFSAENCIFRHYSIQKLPNYIFGIHCRFIGNPFFRLSNHYLFGSFPFTRLKTVLTHPRQFRYQSSEGIFTATFIGKHKTIRSIKTLQPSSIKHKGIRKRRIGLLTKLFQTGINHREKQILFHLIIQRTQISYRSGLNFPGASYHCIGLFFIQNRNSPRFNIIGNRIINAGTRIFSFRNNAKVFLN